MLMTIDQGFADPVLDAQSMFRSILDAMAHPGRIKTTLTANDQSPGFSAPGCLDEATFALALTLLDFETPIWLDHKLAEEQSVIDALRFHCGCPFVDDKAKAMFALISNVDNGLPLRDFHQGTPDYPDRSTTVVIQVSSLSDEGECRLAGPGIKSETRFTAGGLSLPFWQEWSANHQQYPLGIDLVLTAGRRFVALPRSVSVEA